MPDLSSSSGLQKLLRVLTWGCFLLCPIAFTLALMDFGAHGDSSGPGIGLEGAGRPGAATMPLMMIALVGLVGGLVARTTGAEPRVSILRLVGAGLLCFVASLLASRPLFHWKWQHDCDAKVGRACWAIARMTPSGDATATALTRKACSFGDPDACKHLAEGTPDDKAIACTERKTPCANGTWPEPTCKALETSCTGL